MEDSFTKTFTVRKLVGRHALFILNYRIIILFLSNDGPNSQYHSSISAVFNYRKAFISSRNCQICFFETTFIPRGRKILEIAQTKFSLKRKRMVSSYVVL